MSLSREQQILLKRAQQAARIEDDEYRDTLEQFTKLPGCRSSKDERLSNEHLDLLMAYFEAVYWKAVDGGSIAQLASPRAVFAKRGYWASKNTRVETSRDRFTKGTLADQIATAETNLGRFGFDANYFAAIKAKTKAGWPYLQALRRTFASCAQRESAEHAKRKAWGGHYRTA